MHSIRKLWSYFCKYPSRRNVILGELLDLAFGSEIKCNFERGTIMNYGEATSRRIIILKITEYLDCLITYMILYGKDTTFEAKFIFNPGIIHFFRF